MKLLIALAALTGASASYVATLTHLDDNELAPKARGYGEIEQEENRDTAPNFNPPSPAPPPTPPTSPVNPLQCSLER